MCSILVLLSENMQDLQNMLNNVIMVSREYDLTPNVKIKHVIGTKTKVPNEHLYVRDEGLERVEMHDYISTCVNCSVDYYSEIKSRESQCIPCVDQEAAK
ncbi:hypothetical protein Trydic_g13695 [Trypoxylus dichotomus]